MKPGLKLQRGGRVIATGPAYGSTKCDENLMREICFLMNVVCAIHLRTASVQLSACIVAS